MREEMIIGLERELSINIDAHQENGQLVVYRYMDPPHGNICVRIELSITAPDFLIEAAARAVSDAEGAMRLVLALEGALK